MSTLTESIENQLNSLYGEREQLVNEIGVADAAAIITMVRSLESQLRTFYEANEGRAAAANADESSLALQLHDLYAQREQLEQRIGTSDADSIAMMVANLEAQLRELYRDRENGASEAAAIAQRIVSIANELGGQFDGSQLAYENTTGQSRWAMTWSKK
jgi:hypothetical protein